MPDQKNGTKQVRYEKMGGVALLELFFNREDADMLDTNAELGISEESSEDRSDDDLGDVF